MVLELIVIGGVVYYYVRRNKQNKAKKAAWAAGQPWINKDGSLTYPPNYEGLPGAPAYSAVGDYKRQVPVAQEQEVREYRDVPVDEKAPLVVETREVVGDKKY